MKILEKLKDYMVIKCHFGRYGILYRKNDKWWHIVFQDGGQVFNEKDFSEYVSEVYECNETSQYRALQFLAKPEMYIKGYTKIYPEPPKTVDFMTVVKANAEGKKIRCEHAGHSHLYNAGSPGSFFTDSLGYAPLVREILEGIWTVEE